MREAARLVHASGQIAFVPITGSRGGDLALAYAQELEFPTLTLDELARKSVAGDLIRCGCDWSPRRYKGLLSAKQREGVTRVRIIEGARFSPRQFRRVDCQTARNVDPQSASKTDPALREVLGSLGPVVNRLATGTPDRRAKRTPGEASFCSCPSGAHPSVPAHVFDEPARGAAVKNGRCSAAARRACS